ncbi:methylenetetrahydrofolate reductase [NAD(P)H] [Candidatus Fermentibacteria bacterium]|nr:methylenetetrahydrofolate reductase [NAD(P)H] [Candidatus Fermentibacteria bacterium]
MKIKDLYTKGPPVLSLEVFPPRRSSGLDTVFDTLSKLRELQPDFISVTYGAAGSQRDHTVEISSRILSDFEIEPLAHLTCIGHTREEIRDILQKLSDRGIENVLALRGDLPENEEDLPDRRDYVFARDLVRDITANSGFGIGAAAYPEGHVECPRIEQDLQHLKQKVDAGVDFLITQLFFDNRIYYDFVERARKVGIDVPIVPGIMPVLSASQIKRIIYLCGVSIPAGILKLLDHHGDDPREMERAGIEYASRQVCDLLENGVPGVHLYTMNRHRQIRQIAESTGLAGEKKSRCGAEVRGGCACERL